jgi:predicted aminopeptidase
MRRWVRRLARGLAAVALVLGALAGVAWLVSADVRYVLRAALEEALILAARRPITEVAGDTTTDPATRGKLFLVLAVRAFAADSLGLAAGRTYTTYSRLRRDTLVLVLSASPADRLEPYTWRYPIVGRVPYKGFFSFAQAAAEARKLQRLGLDTYLRVANAFSTLGWFADPLLSTVVEEDSVDLAATVIHEIAHNTLFVPGEVAFNESFATFVGYRGAEAFFRARGDRRSAERAAARWRDEVRLSAFYAWLSGQLERLYASGATGPELRRLRTGILQLGAARLAGSLAAELETIDGHRLAQRPLNNAVILAARLYRTRLGDFDRVLEAEDGDLRRAVAVIRDRTAGAEDPWQGLAAR